MQVDVFIRVLLISKKAFDTIPRDKLWERIQHLGITLQIQQARKAMESTLYAKIRINRDTHGEVMSDISVKQGCPFSPHSIQLLH